MSQIALTSEVGQLVAESPETARIFERFGIDYCCGGKMSLAKACARKGVDVVDVLEALEISERRTPTRESGLASSSLADLVDHIVEVHHAYLKEEMPRLHEIIEKVDRVHGDQHPELHEVIRTYADFRTDMEMHMGKEETVLFPMCKQLETTQTRPSFHCGTIENPIDVMEAEHEAAGQALAQMRRLTNDFTPPADACNTYRVMLDGLACLEADTHQHVHLENNILFPRAVAREASLRA
ncbi:MAG TPA: iron-sulfur cluster repair di-iron protein [Armatimonadota bacterium]|nr:iron-sulfur cluster repair di-iron protein [Armatimonadota bacterium]